MKYPRRVYSIIIILKYSLPLDSYPTHQSLLTHSPVSINVYMHEQNSLGRQHKIAQHIFVYMYTLALG